VLFLFANNKKKSMIKFYYWSEMSW